jgi:hypothetical protein
MNRPDRNRDEWDGVPLFVVLSLMLVLMGASLTLAACQPDAPCALPGAASCREASK